MRFDLQCFISKTVFGEVRSSSSGQAQIKAVLSYPYRSSTRPRKVKEPGDKGFSSCSNRCFWRSFCFWVLSARIVFEGRACLHADMHVGGLRGKHPCLSGSLARSLAHSRVFCFVFVVLSLSRLRVHFFFVCIYDHKFVPVCVLCVCARPRIFFSSGVEPRSLSPSSRGAGRRPWRSWGARRCSLG